MQQELKDFDVADYLEDEEDIKAYLNAVISEGDNKQLFNALGNIARARNISRISKETGISREGIYKALSDNGNPSFDTLYKITKAMGLEIHF